MKIYLDAQIWIDACDGSDPALSKWLLSDQQQQTHQFFYSSATVVELFDERYPEANNKRDDFIFQVTKGNCFVPSPIGRAGMIMRPLEMWKRSISILITQETISTALSSGTGSMAKYLEASTEAQRRMHPQRQTPPLPLAKIVDSCVGNDVTNAFGAFVGPMDNAPMRNVMQKHDYSFGQYNHLDGYEFAQKLPELIPPESGDPIEQLMTMISQLAPKDHSLEFQIVALVSLLDQFGYWSDDKKKCQKRGRVIDPVHVVEAAFVDAFVTNDKGLSNRAKATYALLNHKTRVYSSSEMMELL